jgi:uncharacterized protein
MKRLWIVAGIIVLMMCGGAFGQETCSYDNRSKIAVNGEAVVNVAPDNIVINFGIETWDVNIIVAKEKNNEILKKAMTAMKELGIPGKEIQTDHLSIQPRWKDEYRNQGFIGYFVRNTFIVTVTEMAKIEDLVTKVLQTGVNYIHGVDYQTTGFKQYREQSRELALKAAREKADKMAAVLGQSVGVPISISENYSGGPWWYWSSWSGWGYGRGAGMSQNVVQNVQGGSGEISETIALGKISIRANVGVTFELKK